MSGVFTQRLETAGRLGKARPGRSSLGPIGIDLGSRSIKVAQLRFTPTGAELERAVVLHRVRLAESAPVTDTGDRQRGTLSIPALAGILERQGFRGTRLVIGAPEHSISGVVSVPPAAHAARLEVARHEAARAFGFDAGNVELVGWDVQPADTHTRHKAPRDGVDMMVVGVERDWGFDRAACFRAAGLDLCVLDAPCLAKARGALVDQSHDDGIALIDMGWSGLSMIACVHGRIVYERCIESQGFGNYVTRLASELGTHSRVAELMMSSVGLDDEGVLAFGHGDGVQQHDAPSDTMDSLPALRLSSDTSERRCPSSVWEGVRPVRRIVHEYAESMVKEFSAAMRYVGRRHSSVDAWKFNAIGGGAGCPGISQFIRDELGISGSAVRVADVVRTTPRTARFADSTELTTAIGLARRADA